MGAILILYDLCGALHGYVAKGNGSSLLLSRWRLPKMWLCENWVPQLLEMRAAKRPGRKT